MASRMTKYREKLKLTNPELYKEYLEKQRANSRERRDALKKELKKKNPNQQALERKQHILELQRERQKRYNAKKSEMKMSEKVKTGSVKIQFKTTHATRHTVTTKREYNRIMKEKSRALMSPQKKNWEKKKDKERKARKAAERRLQLAKSSNVLKEKSIGDAYPCQKTEMNVTSSARKHLPKDANKYAKIVHNLVIKASPQKQEAMSEIFQTQTEEKENKTTTKKLRQIRKRKSKVDVDDIKMFYKREDISRLVPQKRYATKEGPGYLMQVSIQSAHEKYNSENQSKKVSLGKFAQVRPKNVRKLSQSHREYCVCMYCVNVRFKLLSLSRKSANLNKKKTNEKDILDILLCGKGDNDIFHQAKCINGSCLECKDYENTITNYYAEIPSETFFTWNRWERSSKERNQRELVTKTGNKQVILQELINEDILKPLQGSTFFNHLHNACWQTRQFNNLKNELPLGWTLRVMDFAKNRGVIYQDEIKSAFYTQAQITIHPIVTYYNSDKGVVRDSTVIISEDLGHDYHAVKHYSDIVDVKMEKLLGKDNIVKSVIFSDGCSCQYKSKGPFADISLEKAQVDRNYFGSEHGKGDCDADTGIINRAVDRAIIGKQVVINNSKDMFEFCQANLVMNDTLSKRHFVLVKNTEINRLRPETEIKTLPRTRKLHQLINVKGSPYQVMTRNLSCFCKYCKLQTYDKCLNEQYVDKFEPQNLHPIKCEPKSDPASVATSEIKESKIPHNSALLTPSPKKPTREKYYETKLLTLRSAHTFTTMVEILNNDSTNMDLDYDFLPTHEPLTFINTGLVIDDPSLNLVPDDIPLHSDQTVYPAQIYGDGNCLPRCASVAAFGNEEHFCEMRYRIARELALYPSFYLDNSNFMAGKHQLGLDDVSKAFASVSDCYTGGRLSQSVILSIYKKETQSITRPGSYMGMWQLASLSSVLERPVVSVCPNYGNHNVRPDIHRVFHPRVNNKSEPLCIMWTNINGANIPADQFSLNHFVLLMPITAATDNDSVELLDLSVSFNDSETDILEPDTRNSIQDIIIEYMDSQSEDNENVHVETKGTDLTDSHKTELDEEKVHVETRVTEITDGHKTKLDEEKVHVETRVTEITDGHKTKLDEEKVHVETRVTEITDGHKTKVDEEKVHVETRVTEITDGHKTKVDEEKKPKETTELKPSIRKQCGNYVLIQIGAKRLPAVIDDWPFVKFFAKSKSNCWCLGNIRHTIIEEDIVCLLSVPEMTVMGSRIYYKFEDQELKM